MTLSTNIALAITAVLDDSSPAITLKDSLSQAFAMMLPNSQANAISHGVRTLAGGASEDVLLSLMDSPLSGSGMPSMVFARIKALFIKNTSTSQTIRIGGAAGAPWLGLNGTVDLGPNGVLAMCNPTDPGWACEEGVSDLLRVLHLGDSGSPSVEYIIIVIGASV